MNIDYLGPFRTAEFGYTIDSKVDIEIQPFYDGSVNIITACEDTAPRIVNSRQRFTEDKVELVVREADNLDNVYSNISIEKSLLIPIIGDMVPHLEFNGVKQESGKLPNGGYKYYFKLKTADGIESAIVEESRLVSVHAGTEFGKASSYVDNTITRNSVQFTLSELDTKVYKYVSVYYTRANGMSEPIIKVAYHIEKDYEISNSICQISHTGLEIESLIDVSEIAAEYSPVESVATLSQKNSRLLLGNVKAISTTNELLRTAALCCYIEEEPQYTFYIEQKMYNGNTDVDDSYANSSNIYYKTAYFPGETYEFAINFVYSNGSVSEAYPIMGFDWEQPGIVDKTDFDYGLLGQDIGWYKETPLHIAIQNSYGVVRMKNINIEDTMHDPAPAGKNMATMDVKTLAINTSEMVSAHEGSLHALGIRSYFISRRKRVPDLLMEGLLTLAATAPISSMYPRDATTHTFGMTLGYGLEGSLLNGLVLFPVPGSAMPFSSEGVDVNIGESVHYFDGILYAPLTSKAANTNFALYSPEITSDTSKISMLSTKNTYSIYTSSLLHQSIDYVDQRLVSVTPGQGPSRYAYSANPYRFSFPFNNGSSENGIIQNLQFVDDSVRAFSNMTFTGKLDRQNSLYLYSTLHAYAEHGDSVDDCIRLNKGQQAIFSNSQLAKDINYTSDVLLKDSGIICGSLPWDPDNPYTQILMTGVNYSPYIGIKLDTAISTRITDALTLPVNFTPQKNGFFTAYADIGDMVPADYETKMGTVVRVYSNSESNMMNTYAWSQKYSITRAGNYFAVSERFRIDHPLDLSTSPWGEPMLPGGDCYAGFYYQRAWRPGGIAGVPTANNPHNYIGEADYKTREGVNITNSGYSIGFPVRSTYNFAIRALYEADEIEKKLYGTPRTYTSSFPIDETHGNRQAETSVINYGNIIEESILETSQNDPNIPYIQLEYPNRVLTSEIAVTGEFENGYRNFKGLNFKDYDEELGSLTIMTSSGLYTYLVYSDGVAIIEISERSAITSEDLGTNVYVASSDVLPPKSTPVFTNLGSQHLNSVINTEGAIYGVDANTKKIWGIKIRETNIISDQRIQTLLNELISPDLKDIISSYDAILYEVTFTFIYEDDSHKAILYNTLNDIWYGTTNVYKYYQFNVDDESLSLQSYNDTFSLYYPTIHLQTMESDEIESSELVTINTIHNSYVEFVLKHNNLEKFNLSNLIINGSGSPTSIDIISESIEGYNIGAADILVNGLETQTIPLHTNIYMIDALQANLVVEDDYTITRTQVAGSKVLEAGDKITLLLTPSNILQQFTIASITTSTGIDTIILSQAILAGTTDITTLYYGWKVPIRVSLGEDGSGKVKFTIPSKKHADLIKNISGNSQNYHSNQASAKPYGRWIKLRLNFEGLDQIYIESIISDTTLRYS